MRLWRRREAPPHGGTYSESGAVWVAGLKLQCETCGVPVDGAQVEKVGKTPPTAWIRTDPCGHVISVPLAREDA